MRRFSAIAKEPISGVSIHASVKDATVLLQESYKSQRVSIHASVKDATSLVIKLLNPLGFQSTHL